MVVGNFRGERFVWVHSFVVDMVEALPQGRGDGSLRHSLLTHYQDYFLSPVAHTAFYYTHYVVP